MRALSLAAAGVSGALLSQPAGGRRMCVLNGTDPTDEHVLVRIYRNNVRSMSFEHPGEKKEVGSETTVQCEGPVPESCFGGEEESCPPCPCTMDGSGLAFSYARVMWSQVRQRCQSFLRPLGWKPPRFLIIGYGGGSIPGYLLENCPEGTVVESVEYNPKVIEAARRYFGSSDTKKFRIEHNDALPAVAQRVSAGAKYDAVIVDCFTGNGAVPDHCRNQEFLGDVSLLLERNGKLLQNIWHYSPKSDEVKSQFQETLESYRRLFGATTQVLNVPMPPEFAWNDVLMGVNSG
mmetsp:Transcript_21627/g.52754  ORF Transcript_21627/g.52754 Transcript_21627/m.52754 type:complete len:291 (+) Transcript_21627:72-944(+)